MQIGAVRFMMGIIAADSFGFIEELDDLAFADTIEARRNGKSVARAMLRILSLSRGFAEFFF